MIYLILTFVSVAIVLYLSDYVYFKSIILKSLQPAITRVLLYKFFIYLVISVCLYLSLRFVSYYSVYWLYTIVVIYISYAFYRYNFYKKSTNIIKILKDYKKLSFGNTVTLIKGIQELDTEDQLKLVAKWYFRRWRYDEFNAEVEIDLIFNSIVKPTNVKSLILQIFTYGHLANDEAYLNEIEKEDDLIDKLYNKVIGSQVN